MDEKLRKLETEIIVLLHYAHLDGLELDKIASLMVRVSKRAKRADHDGEFLIPCHNCGCLDCGGWNCGM